MRVLAAFLAGVSMVAAQGPRLTDKAGGNTLPVEDAVVRVSVVNGVAETSLELNFRNEEPRWVEGEFVLPLPAGATVSSYALEVNGKLREAVAVERERARTAYEEIKARRIDPGIVEREAGNVYRTRVYPVPGKGTKRLRIGYVETLPVVDGRFEYRLPLKLHGVVRSFEWVVEGAGTVAFEGATKLDLREPERGGHEVRLADVEIDGTLIVRSELPAAPVMRPGPDGTFLITDVFPEIDPEPRPRPERVRLFWDASESAGWVGPEATFEVLDAWFRRVGGSLTVSLVLLRDTAEEGGGFVIERGNWEALRRVLEGVVYEGATSLAAVEARAEDTDVAIYCGDGVGTLDERSGLASVPLHVLRRGGGEVSRSLRWWVEHSGGAWVEVGPFGAAEPARWMTESRPRLIRVEGDGVKSWQVGTRRPGPGDPVVVSGRMEEVEGATWTLCYGWADGEVIRREVKVGWAGGHVVERLWAQRKLEALESEPEPDRRQILEHARDRGLVSAETSLIVLERFEDHLSYRIPPPEPELRKRYEREIGRVAAREDSDSLLAAWTRRQQWHARDFPGAEYVLLPRWRQVGVWKRAVEEVFDPVDLDGRAFAEVAGWHDEVRGFIGDKKALKDGREYEAWRARIPELAKRGAALADTPVADRRPLAVSVRGLVEEPGVLRSDGALTIEEAVKRGGGPLPYAKLDAVALYRNGGKTIYNTLSKAYEPVPLKPGDMLVVDQAYDEGWDVDPFGGWSSDPADGPAVVAQRDVWVTAGSGDAFGKVGVDGGSGVKEVRVFDFSESDMPGFTDFERELAAGADAVEAYRRLLDGKRRPGRFYVEAARRLVEAGQWEFARRVLSTLVERGGGSAASRRAHAFWLLEFGQVTEAARVIAGIPDDGARASASIALAGMLDEEEAVGRLAAGVSESLGDARVVALAELNPCASETHPIGGILAANLPVDLRIVVLGDDPDLLPRVDVEGPVDEPGTDQAVWLVDRFSRLPRGLALTGGRLTVAPGVWEFMDRDAVPGTYRLRIRSGVDATFRIALHTNWGRENVRTEWLTRFVGAHDPEEVAELEYEFRPSGE